VRLSSWASVAASRRLWICSIAAAPLIAARLCFVVLQFILGKNREMARSEIDIAHAAAGGIASLHLHLHTSQSKSNFIAW